MERTPHIGSTLDTAHLAATGEVRPLPYGRCPTCGGDVDLCKGTGRTREVARDVVLPIPDDLALPTCVRCGERPATPEVTAVLDALLDAIAERDEANEQNATVARECVDLRARLAAAEAERDRLVALRAAEAEKVIRRDEHIAKVEAERDDLGNEAVDRLMLISDLRAVVLATCERAQEVEVELAKANALLREAHAWVWAVSDRDADTVRGLRARIEAHLEGR